MKILIVMCLLFSSLSWAAGGDVSANAESEAKLIERGIRLVNQRKSWKAKIILKSESLKENADAQFWLGVALYRSSEHFIAGDAFLKSANLGNPWAMAVLGGGRDNIIYQASPCGYLGWGCDKKWNDKAIKIWKGLAEKGDPDALYAYTLTKKEWFEYVPFYGYRRFLERVEQAIPNRGGYEFLYHFSWDYDDKVKYAKMAAEQGYAPAMQKMSWYKDDGVESADKWANKSLKFGYYGVADDLHFIYQKKSREVATKAETIELLKKAYYYSVVSALLKGGDYDNWLTTRILEDAQGKGVEDENGYYVKEVMITKTEQAEIEQQAKDFLKGVKVNLFLTKNSYGLFTF